MLSKLFITSIFITGVSFYSSLAMAEGNRNEVQVEVDGETYKLNVRDIPGFKEYLEELPVNQRELEKKRLRAWLPDTGEKDTLVIGTACGMHSCDLSVLKKIPGENKWTGIELEDGATYQESVVSPDHQKIAVLTAQQISPEKTPSSIKNNVYALKLDPATKKLAEIQDASPINIFDKSYSETLQNIKFENNEKFTFKKLTQLPTPPTPDGPESGTRPDFIKMEGRIGD